VNVAKKSKKAKGGAPARKKKGMNDGGQEDKG
jgi:hypothetical protein